ncbi:MAG: hypothetical protein JW940_26910 [Polyangiaceae bacterium]|nr:hypothetical protein [Polyangiaceae bacterium]
MNDATGTVDDAYDQYRIPAPLPYERGTPDDPRYIGAATHVQLARLYRRRNPVHTVFANDVAIDQILRLSFNTLVDRAESKLYSGKPDILVANTTPNLVYEIKPVHNHGLLKASFQLQSYISGLGGGRVLVVPGDPKYLGGWGYVPAPGGYAKFECARPGVILYHYFKA